MPPQKLGAPLLLLLKPPLHPPLALAVASHVVNAASACACDVNGPTVVFVGQINDTVGGANTVKVAAQVEIKGAQLLV